MRILLTGASSFTGCWFADTLARAGHGVVCTMTRPAASDYADDPVRSARVEMVARTVTDIAWGCRFGDDRFLSVLNSVGFDAVAHHAADVTDYRSPDFDAVAALANNVAGIGPVLDALASSGGAFVLTGTVFERGEGAGSEGLPHFSPYGLSKALTAEVTAYQCRRRGVPFRKFVIPNPFGPLEKPAFTAYLIKTWAAGETPVVRTPEYVRDNIHVSLLAKAYAGFVERAARPGTPATDKTSPSGYVESQGRFAQRFADEMAPRLGIACPVDLAEQTEFAEPRVRIGTDPVEMTAAEEAAAWDAIADDYKARVLARA